MPLRQLGVPLLLLTLSVTILLVTLLRYAQEHNAPAAPSTRTFLVTPLATPIPTPTPTPTPTPPHVSARAFLVLDLTSDDVLMEQASHQPLPPASTLKLLTALTGRDLLQPEDIVTIQPEDVVDPTVESAMGLAVGDTVTVYDLLLGLLLPSGNDAAETLARVAGAQLTEPADLPPRERFLHAMQRKAQLLNLRETVVRSPDGEDVPDQVTSAADLAQLTRAVLSDPVLATIVAMRQAQVRIGGPNARILTLTNTNELLGQFGLVGVKTGTSPAAGQCLIAAWRTHDEHLLLAVILNSQDRYGDLQTLIRWVTQVTGQVPLP